MTSICFPLRRQDKIAEAAAGDALAGTTLVPAISVAGGTLVLRKGDQIIGVVEQASGRIISGAELNALTATIGGKTCVYSCVTDGITRYIGVTDDILKRRQAHIMEKGIDIEKIESLPRLSSPDACAVEQTLIEYRNLKRI